MLTVVLLTVTFTWKTVETQKWQSKNCPQGPQKLHAVVDHYNDYLEMDTDNYFRLFGEDARSVEGAFLSGDPICWNKAIDLRQRDTALQSAVLREFETDGPLISPDDRVLFFFCTDQKGTLFNHMVQIPQAKDYNKVYLMLPVLFVVLCMSATFSGLNLAIMSFSISDLQLIQESDLELKNRERAADVLRLRRHSNFVLCTIVCGNCFCNTTITILINYFGEVFGFGEFFFVELLATALLLVFTEILPALVFTKNALKYAGKLQNFVIFAMIVTFPISFPLSKILDKVLGKDDDDGPGEVDSEQLEGMRDEGANENFNEIMNVLKKTVELRKKRAEDVMTPIERVRMTSDEETILMNESFAKGHSRVPVHRAGAKDQICGVLNIKDLILLLDGAASDFDDDDVDRRFDTKLTAGTLLSVLKKRKKHSFVLNTMPVQQFMSELQKGCTMAIVVKYVGDEEEATEEKNYKVIGIITLEDYMEEIVGDIFDEKDSKDSMKKSY